MNNTDNMTDAEVWALIAAMLEGSKHLNGVNSGLCYMLSEMFYADLIDTEQEGRMCFSLRVNRSKITKTKSALYFWPKGRVEPRIAACWKLAELAAKEEL